MVWPSSAPASSGSLQAQKRLPQLELHKVFRSASRCTPPARARARCWIEGIDLPSMLLEFSGAGLPESSNIFPSLRSYSCYIVHN